MSASSTYPQLHLWTGLQRRFAEQHRASVAPEQLMRAIKVVPLAGQESAATWSLGFREDGTVRRSASLSRDFQHAAMLVEPDAICYIVLYVADLHEHGQAKDKAAWVLLTYVPDACGSVMSKKAQDNRDGLKAGLGAERFCGDLFVSSRE